MAAGAPASGSASWYISPTGILALLVVAIAAIVLQWTRFGRTIYAVGGNEQSARLMGLHVARTKILAYVISGVCGGSRRARPHRVLGRRLPAVTASEPSSTRSPRS